MSVFPTSYDVFTPKTDKIDLVNAAHVNSLQDSVVAIEKAIGTYPGGTFGTLTHRLAVMMDSNGAIVGSNAYPSVTYAKQPFYRTDTDVFYIRDAANATWNQVGGNISNTVFSASATGAVEAGSGPVLFSSSLIFQKISQMNTLTFALLLKNTSAIENSIISYAIAQVAGTKFIASTVGTTAYALYTGTYNVSALTNGSFYTIWGSIRTSNINGTASLNGWGIFAS